MLYDKSKKAISVAASFTPNTLLPRIGEWATGGKIKFYIWAEIYLFSRFVFSILAALLMPTNLFLGFIVALIQLGSAIYLLKVVFPVGKRGLRDPSRSLFFALGHYLEIGFSMAYVYWSWGVFSVACLSRVDSIYYSFITMTTLGYGDIYPVSDLTKILATFQTLAGMFMFAIVIGLFLSKSSQDH
ncbi:potassium channel family protein [Kushneria sp. EE4]